ncbi:signal transduction histidine kinase [Friedmanniella endophytica]|uniref:histidine kinase n=1 Tax=Microlunatus kandeliicorticis TaxID=1759536 RepID=A0A7W3IU75_9ACTN|nr:sensor histidine kinase [Microlunatus kandeliicorticis]MBA8795351.1 signal transduction histidine kinase [Microlunatus kandeliicorticis]
MTSTEPDHRTRPDPGALVRRCCRDLGLLTATFVVALLGFVVATTLFAVGIGTAVIGVGLVVLVAALVTGGGFARFHRLLLARAGVAIVPPRYPAPAPGVRGRLRRLAHPQSWRELLHVLVAFVVSCVTFPLGLTWFVAGPGGLSYPFWSRYLPGEPQGLAWLLGFPGRLAEDAVNVALGLVLLLTAPVVLRGLVLVHAGLARALLDDEAGRLRSRVEDLTSSRAAAGQAETATLRRLERDLHDGPQQRLIRVGLDISAAHRRLAADPDGARAILDEALQTSREALAEIRSLSRGIAPPILAEQGLPAALITLAARCPVATAVAVSDEDRLAGLSPAAQNAVYFTVAEALANVAKHSGAAAARVELRAVGALAVVSVGDDGRGGADVGKGHGLAGLADRLEGVDGRLEVSSPVGGPTHLTATLPLG